MITDYHVHLETGPYTMEWLKKYLDMANEKGITDLGFSEHAYRFKQTEHLLSNPWITARQTEDLNEYIGLIETAKNSGLPVKLGIELDYTPGKKDELAEFINSYPWDYVIGSVHWLGDWGFDLKEMIAGWDDRPVIDIYEDYFAVIERLIESKLFDILGHLDVIKVYGHRPEPAEQDRLFALYDNITDKIANSGIVVEMSTAGLRKPVQELYPAPELMKRLVELDIPMIINSDAHHPSQVGEFYEQGLAYLQEYGVKQTALFAKRERTLVNLG
jgi:histidinol-phosphatase (PHP family)